MFVCKIVESRYMASSSSNSSSKILSTFQQDKQFFFAEMRKKKHSLEEIDTLAKTKSYSFKLENKDQIDAEFNDLQAVLTQDQILSTDHWQYAYYCACLMKSFNLAYTPLKNNMNDDSFDDNQTTIRNHLLSQTKKAEYESFVDHLVKKIQKFLHTPFHLAQIRDYIGYLNLCRLYWIFSRLTLTNAFTLLKNSHLLDKLADALGPTHIDTDKIITAFQAPNFILNYLSIGIFLSRLLIDSILLLKHTFFSQGTEEQSADKWTRFKFELFKRHFNFINDIAWAIVNFLTNFTYLSHIPVAAAAPITAIFLGFDVMMLLWRYYLARKAYAKKCSDYNAEERAIDDKKSAINEQMIKLQQQIQISSEIDKSLRDQLTVCESQLALLEVDLKIICAQREQRNLEWKATSSTLQFATSAAGILVLGFSASLIFTPPGIIITSFFVCIVAAAMYFSMNEFARFKKQQLIYQKYSNEQNLKEYHEARKQFIITVVENALIPTALLSIFALCWPAAVALTLFYAGYKLYQAYEKHPKPASELPPIIEDLENTQFPLAACP